MIKDEDIPDLEGRPSDEPRFMGDLAKIGGIIHVWDGSKWVNLNESRNIIYNAQEPANGR